MIKSIHFVITDAIHIHSYIYEYVTVDYSTHDCSKLFYYLELLLAIC